MLEKHPQPKLSLQFPVPRDLPTLQEIAQKVAQACGAIKVNNGFISDAHFGFYK